MNKFENIAGYVYLGLREHKLTEYRLEKVMYLCDWYSALVYEKTVTNFQWMFKTGDIRPVSRIREYFGKSKFTLTYTAESLRKSSAMIEYHGEAYFPLLTDQNKEVIDSVLDATKGLASNELVYYAGATYPYHALGHSVILDLCNLAKEYKEKKKV